MAGAEEARAAAEEEKAAEGFEEAVGEEGGRREG